MAAEQSPPPPLDPTLILHARTALHAAGLPGDAASDEAVAGLVAMMGSMWNGMSSFEQWEMIRWRHELADPPRAGRSGVSG